MIPITYSDMRRAAAAVAHFGQDNIEGVNEVLSQADTEGRAYEAVLAILALYAEIVPELRTDAGMSLMSSHIYKLAEAETQS